MPFRLEFCALKNGSEFDTCIWYRLLAFLFDSCVFFFIHLHLLRHHLPPLVNTPDVQLEIQLDRPLKAVIERLKSISPIIYVDGSMKGELVLRVENDSVSIKTFYDKLIPRIDDQSEKMQSQESARCTLKVDSKKLLASLQWQSAMTRGSVSSYIICMIENEMMVVHVVLNPEELGFVTYYIPVHYISHDDMMDSQQHFHS